MSPERLFKSLLVDDGERGNELDGRNFGELVLKPTKDVEIVLKLLRNFPF